MKLIKRILALMGVVLIISVIVITFISAFFTTEKSNQLFLAGLFSAFTIPVMIYAYLLIYKLVHKKDYPEDINKKESSHDKNVDENSLDEDGLS